MMEPIPADAFWHWAAKTDIGVDPKYPNSGCLSLLPQQHGRFWIWPTDPACWPHFLDSLVARLDEWKSGYLWPRPGRWPAMTGNSSTDEGVRDVMLRGAGIPLGWAGAVRVASEQKYELVTVLYAFLAFGGCTDDDVFFVPDHGRQLLQTDHHDVVHLKCRTENRVLEVVAGMKEAGYELPTVPPDETFIRPSWMGVRSIMENLRTKDIE